MPVTVNIVDSADWRPVFIIARVVIIRKKSVLFAVRQLPVLQQQAVSMWCIMQHIVDRVSLAGFYVFDFLSDTDQCLTEAVDLALIFTFGGFNHHGVSHGKGHSGRVETVVD